MNNKILGTENVIQVTNSSGADISAGQPILIGDQGLKGFCVQDIANGSEGSVAVSPSYVVDYPVKGHDGSSNAAVAIGDKVYYTAGEAFCDVDTDQTFIGYALEVVTSGSTTTVNVLLARNSTPVYGLSSASSSPSSSPSAS